MAVNTIAQPARSNSNPANFMDSLNYHSPLKYQRFLQLKRKEKMLIHYIETFDEQTGDIPFTMVSNRLT